MDMNISHPESIEDHILILLQSGSLSSVELIEEIKKRRPKTTKQGVYLILKRLKKEEIIVIHNKQVSLSTVWLTDMEEFFSKANYSAKSVTTPGNAYLGLRDGEKLQYFFKNPILTDAFWSHVFLTLFEATSPRLPVLIYNPHEWFILVRRENESELFKRIHARGQELAILAGGKTTLDKIAQEYLKETNCMYSMLDAPLFPKNNYYINVIGDFVIEVWLDKHIMNQVESFYKSHEVCRDEEIKTLQAILMQKGKNKFSITKSKRKADDIRRKFKKYFPFKKYLSE
jgi:hypothetical protein